MTKLFSLFLASTITMKLIYLLLAEIFFLDEDKKNKNISNRIVDNIFLTFDFQNFWVFQILQQKGHKIIISFIVFEKQK